MKIIDLIFSRYSSAETLIDGYISTGRFCFFIDGFVEICNEEQTYDVWKHKVNGKSFAEFRDEVYAKPVVPEKVDVRGILKDSFEILVEFTPKEVG